jgi:hypothetical protein
MPILVNDTVHAFCKVCVAKRRTFSLRLRSYIGFLPVRPPFRTQPISPLLHCGIVGPPITQNVDGLHYAALRDALSEVEVDTSILELDGVSCGS